MRKYPADATRFAPQEPWCWRCRGTRIRSILRRIMVAASLCCLMKAPAAGQVAVTYTYDELDRLVVVERSDGPSITYAFDTVSNLTATAVGNSPDTDGDGAANFADAETIMTSCRMPGKSNSRSTHSIPRMRNPISMATVIRHSRSF